MGQEWHARWQGVDRSLSVPKTFVRGLQDIIFRLWHIFLFIQKYVIFYIFNILYLYFCFVYINCMNHDLNRLLSKRKNRLHIWKLWKCVKWNLSLILSFILPRWNFLFTYVYAHNIQISELFLNKKITLQLAFSLRNKHRYFCNSTHIHTYIHTFIHICLILFNCCIIFYCLKGP